MPRTNSPARRQAAKSTVQIKLRRRLPFVWLAVLLLLALALPDRVWNTLLVGLGGLLALAYGWAWLLADGLHATRRLRFGWVAVGDRLEERFELHNDSPLSALWVEVIDHSNVPGYSTAVVRSVGANATDRWWQAAICQRRGQFTLGPWSIRSGDPFGIFTTSRHYPVTNEIIIHPPVHGTLPVPLPAGQSSGRVRVRQRAWRAVLNAATVREYRPNDPYHWIHWPTSARRDDLFVRQFDRDAAGDVWLLLDLRGTVQLGEGIKGTEEHAILIAAALTAQALRQNRAVGLASYGREPQLLPPGRGQGQQWKILRALALAKADGDTDLRLALRDLGRTAQRGTAAVIITASDTADWLPDLLTLSQRGIESNVILLDRPSFGGKGNSEALRQAVRQLGFTCHVMRQGEIGQPIEEAERRGFWEFRVTAMGRAVPVKSPREETGA